MKHRIFVNGKPLETLTLLERKELDKAIANSFKKYMGVNIPLNDEDYISEYPASVKEA